MLGFQMGLIKSFRKNIHRAIKSILIRNNFFLLIIYLKKMQVIKQQAIDVNRGSESFRKKNLKLKLAETVYICECEKKFLSFPAIYSHAKQKHGRKLSSKLDSGTFRRVLQNNQQKVYFNSAGDQDAEANLNNRQISQLLGKNITNKVLNFKIITKMNKMITAEGKANIYGVICQYLESLAPQIVGEQLVEISDTLLVLTQCLNSHYMIHDQRKVHTNYCRDSTAERVPLFLNFLVMWYVPSLIEKLTIKINFDTFCSYLKVFCVWLEKEKFTDYDIELSQCNQDLMGSKTDSDKKFG